MKKQFELLGVLAILFTVELSGCNQVSNTINPEKNKFVGTWQGKTSDITGVHNITIILFSDGTSSFKGFSGTWDLKDGKLVIEITTGMGSGTFVFNYTFSNNDRTLTITAMDTGTILELEKQ